MSDSGPAGRYTVLSIDNGSFGRGGPNTRRQEFDSPQDAVAYAQMLVDGALTLHFDSARSAHDLMTLYTISGSAVPKIYGEPRVEFHAYRYAREKANSMFALPAS